MTSGHFLSLRRFQTLELQPVHAFLCEFALRFGFGTTRKANLSHGSAARCGEFDCFADPRKHITLCDAFGVTFVNSRPQRHKFRLVFLLFAFQSAQRRAHYLAGIHSSSVRLTLRVGMAALRSK
jgi:hypothetical protein